MILGEGTPTHHVVGIFLQYENTFLLLDRAKDPYWGVPAGKVEHNEKPDDAIVREIREEIGISIKPTFEREYLCQHEDRIFTYHLYEQKLIEKPVLNLNKTEIKDYKWVTPQEALSFNLIEDEDVCINDYFNSN